MSLSGIVQDAGRQTQGSHTQYTWILGEQNQSTQKEVNQWGLEPGLKLLTVVQNQNIEDNANILHLHCGTVLVTQMNTIIQIYSCFAHFMHLSEINVLIVYNSLLIKSTITKQKLVSCWLTVAYMLFFTTDEKWYLET